MGLISRSFLDPAGDPAKGSTQKPSYGLNSPSTMRKRPGGCGGSEATPQEGRRDVPGLCAWGILPQPPGGLLRRLCMSRCPSRRGGFSGHAGHGREEGRRSYERAEREATSAQFQLHEHGIRERVVAVRRNRLEPKGTIQEDGTSHS